MRITMAIKCPLSGKQKTDSGKAFDTKAHGSPEVGGWSSNRKLPRHLRQSQASEQPKLCRWK